MKKIIVTLSDEAEKVFNEIMYSLPKEEDGTGMCNQSEAISYALNKMWLFEQEDQLSPQQPVSVKPRPGDFYESEPEGDRINESTGRTWREEYKHALNKWSRSL